MKAKHVKFTVEFDVPIKDAAATMNETAYNDIYEYIHRCVNYQRFYFVRGDLPSHYMRTRNISIVKEITDTDIKLPDSV